MCHTQSFFRSFFRNKRERMNWKRERNTVYSPASSVGAPSEGDCWTTCVALPPVSTLVFAELRAASSFFLEHILTTTKITNTTITNPAIATPTIIAVLLFEFVAFEVLV